MSTEDPTPDQPTPGSQPPPPPPPPPPAPPAGTGYGAPAAGAPGLGQGLAQPTVPGFPPARQSDETIWALLAHLSFFVLALIGPLIIMLVSGQERPFAREHAVEALNFHITVFIGFIISFILIFVVIGIFTMIALFIAGAIFTILAAIKAGQGEGYRYPVNIRMVK